MASRHQIRVYYEDTDLAGIVYHANYLRFTERARTEALRAAGIDQGRLRAEAGLVFVVAAIEARFLMPAHFDDLLEVLTRPLRIGRAGITLSQDIRRGADLILTSTVRLGCVGADGRPARLPEAVRAALHSLVKPGSAP